MIEINPSKLITFLVGEQPQAVCIYLALMAWASLSGEEDATLSMEDLVKYTGTSKNSVIRHIKEMERKGILQIVRGKGKASNRYRLVKQLS